MRNRARQPKPEWQRQVDHDMRLYLTWGRTIEHQTNILLALDLTGQRVTPVYELREGKGSGPAMHQAEKIAITRDLAERKIEAGKAYRATLEAIAREAAGGDPDKEIFVRRYWWTADVQISIRARYVTDALPFLAKKDWGTRQNTKPNNTFYRWRDCIYEKLAELMGYLPEMGEVVER